MATIGETIDLDVPIGVARKKWNEYVSGMVIGSGLGPREREYPFRWRKAEREAEQGALQFAAIGDGITRLTVALEFPELGSDEPAEAARIETLFIPVNDVVWGKFDAASGKARIQNARRTGDEDLFDRAVVETIRTGGRVLCLPKEGVPDGGPTAAIRSY